MTAADPTGRVVRPVRVALVPGGAQAALDPIVVGAAPGATLQRHDAVHATLRPGQPADPSSGSEPASPVAVLLFPLVRRGAAPVPDGAVAIEVIVDGWRFEVLVEDEARAALRERATRGRGAEVSSRPAEVRAMIPGRVASVAVVAGDAVEVGSPLLVIEAMKMQNELRAARAGTVTRVAVEAGRNVDAGDLLVVIE